MEKAIQLKNIAAKYHHQEISVTSINSLFVLLAVLQLHPPDFNAYIIFMGGKQYL